MASTGAHKQFRPPPATAAHALPLRVTPPLGITPTAAVLAVLLPLLLLFPPHPRAALAASAVSGGTSPPAGGATAPSTTSGGATPSGPRSKGNGTTVSGGSAPSSHRASPTAKIAVKIAAANCVPASNCGTKAHQVSTHGTLQLHGVGLKSGQAVAFPRARGARIASNSPSAHLHQTKLGLVVTVPASAHSGYIAIRLSGGRNSSAFGPISVVRYKLHPPPPPPTPAPPPVASGVASSASGTAFAGQGMWIWYVNASDGGNVASIVTQAHAAGVTTLFIKSSDGSSNYWSQFSAQLVSELHANGLRVCAWQYVYGTNPVGEANLGAQAAAAGADCLVIDAESQYEGHYAAAQTYIATLRSHIGPSYPVGLASFPYVDYHPSFPYSVFMGPEGAQFNAPQMYWHDIGTSVANVFVHTYEENLVYGRPIVPLGQTYGGVSPTDIVSFRSLATAYGAPGDSFWDWQETSTAGWGALVAPLNTALTVPQPELTSPLLREGAKSDQVLWLQEHLASAVPGQPTTGVFEAQTTTDLEQFQAAHGIPATGETDAGTWGALLALPPVAVNWTGGGPQT